MRTHFTKIVDHYRELGDAHQGDEMLSTLVSPGQLTADETFLLAVLEDAIACFRGIQQLPTFKRWKLSRAAKNWILAEDNIHFFAFRTVCQRLSLDPEAIRGELKLVKFRRKNRLVESIAASKENPNVLGHNV